MIRRDLKGRIHKRIWIREISLRGLKIANGGIALRRFLNEEERVFRLKREKYSKGESTSITRYQKRTRDDVSKCASYEKTFRRRDRVKRSRSSWITSVASVERNFYLILERRIKIWKFIRIICRTGEFGWIINYTWLNPRLNSFTFTFSKKINLSR